MSVDYSTLGARLWAPPRGWYRLGPAPDPGAVAGGAVGDRPLVAWADAGGDTVVADAVCPHLGADLRAGAIADDCLVCPFHGWAYGADGDHRGTPAGRIVPGARLTLLPSRVVAGDVHVFHEPDDRTPEPWEPLLDEWAALTDPDADDEAVEVRVVDKPMEAPPVVVAEGAFDVAHFSEVHGVEPEAMTWSFEGTAARMSFQLGQGRNAFGFAFEMDGLTSLLETIRRDRYVVRRRFSLTSDGSAWRSHVVSSGHGPRRAAVVRLLDTLEEAADRDLQEDAKLWKYRRFDQPSVYGPADRALREFRAWAMRFLTPVGGA